MPMERPQLVDGVEGSKHLIYSGQNKLDADGAAWYIDKGLFSAVALDQTYGASIPEFQTVPVDHVVVAI